MTNSLPEPVTSAVSLAYKISPSFGKAVEEQLTGLWGDPKAIRSLSQEWTALSTAVGNTSKMIERDVRAVDGDWEGSAKDAYTNWMTTLNDESLTVLSDQFKQISKALDDTAGDVDSMNGEVTRLCTYFVGVVGGLIWSGPKGKLEAFGAAIAFIDKLSNFKSVYLDRLRPRLQIISEIDAEVSEGSVGVQIPHAPDMGHPFPYTTQEYADSYKWNILGDWRNWKSLN